MLIHYPHNLCCVHCGTAAYCDDCIGFKVTHHIGTLASALESRVGSNLREASVLNTKLVKLILNRLCITVIIKERVGYYKRLFLTHNVTKLIESNGKAAFFEIYFLRSTEPKHIFPSFCNSFDIDEMLYADILGNRVAAPRTAAECKRRSKLEVVKVTDTAL